MSRFRRPLASAPGASATLTARPSRRAHQLLDQPPKLAWSGLSLLSRTDVSRPVLMYSRDYDTPGCQPDMFFQAAQARLFVELKIGAQAAPDQLHRYAALAAWLGRHDREQPWAIVFMGPSEKRFESIRRAAELGANGDISSKVLARCAAMKVSRADLESALQRMELATTSYVAFDHRLVAELDALFDYSPSEAGLREGDEALSKLIRGMRAFLQDVIM